MLPDQSRRIRYSRSALLLADTIDRHLPGRLYAQHIAHVDVRQGNDRLAALCPDAPGGPRRQRQHGHDEREEVSLRREAGGLRLQGWRRPRDQQGFRYRFERHPAFRAVPGMTLGDLSGRQPPLGYRR